MPNCRVTGYDHATGQLSFVAKPDIAGLNRLSVAIAGTGTRTYAGKGGQGLFVDAAGSSTFVMPDAATVESGILVAGSESSIVVNTGTATNAIVDVFYGPTGPTAPTGPSVDGLVICGTGTLTLGTATVRVTIPSGTWRLFARVTSPSGIRGPFIALTGSAGASSTVTSRTASVRRMWPATIVESKQTSVEFHVDGLEDCTLSVYRDDPTLLVGTAALASGVARLTMSLPAGTRRIRVSPSGPSGPMLEAGLMTVTPYVPPTSVTYAAVTAVAGTPFVLVPTFVPPISGAVVVSTGPTGPRIGEGTAASITCTVASAGTYALYFTWGDVTLAASQLLVRYVEPTALTLSGPSGPSDIAPSFSVGTKTSATAVLSPVPATTASLIAVTLGTGSASVTSASVTSVTSEASRVRRVDPN